MAGRSLARVGSASDHICAQARYLAEKLVETAGQPERAVAHIL